MGTALDNSGPAPAAPAAPAPPSALDTSLQQFTDLLGTKGSGGAVDDYFNEAARLQAVGTGADDPAFAAYQQSGINQLNANQKADTASQAEFFTRRGLGDSSAALNQQNKTAASYDLQRNSLAASVGMQALTRKDDAFASSLGAESAGVTAAGSAPALLISQLAAQNAGTVPTSSNSGGTCCFIFLEARYGNGTMDSVVRRFRDEKMTAKNQRGYYKLAEVIVPLMRKWAWFKWFIIITMTSPLVSYGKWYYKQNRWGWVFAPVKSFWLNLFNYLGGEHPFIRENGEVI